MKRLLIALLLLAASHPSWAENQLLTVRSNQAFPEAMLALQDAIGARGYKVARVQHVDVGLTKVGYKTDRYRIVFYGKAEEVKRLTAKYPDLIPYLPLSFSIFAELDQTLIVALDPMFLSSGYTAPELQPIFKRWSTDVRSILAKLRKISIDE